MLDSLDSKNTNIHDLNLEEPQEQNEFPGDVRKWIGPMASRIIKSNTFNTKLNEDSFWASISEERRSLLILFPDSFPVKYLTRIPLELGLENHSDKGNLDDTASMYAFSQAAYSKFLLPDQELIKESEWEQIEYLLRLKAKLGMLLPYFDISAKVKLLSDEKVKEFDLNNQNTWQLGLEQLKILKEDDKWSAFIKLASDMKTLNPEKFKAFQITDQDWINMRNHLMSREDLIKQAGYILILQAEEIRMSPEKVEVIMPKPKVPLVEEIPALPEVRKF